MTLTAEEIQRCFPQVHVRGFTPIIEGWDFWVADVNDGLIFRMPRRADGEAQLDKEMSLLPELARHLPVEVPAFEMEGRSSGPDGRRIVGYRKIPGVPLRRQALVASDRSVMARQLAGVLSALHAFPVSRAVGLGVPDASAEQWRDDYTGLYQWLREHVSPLLEDEVWSRAARLWEGFLGDSASVDFTPALVHRDLGVEHILCRPERSAVTGVIDWGDAATGDPAIDFVGLLLEHGRGFVEEVLASYQGEITPGFWRRALFYSRIGAFYEVRHGLLTGDDAHVRIGLQSLRRQLLGEG